MEKQLRRIAVVGLGQIGGSIVLALRKFKRYSITGIDTSSKRLRLLNSSLHRASTKWKDAQSAQLTVICLHYEPALNFLQQAEQNQLLLDVCSGKAKLIRVADRKKLRLVGGHPMAGNEFPGESGWRQDLFQKTSFFLCPSNHASGQDVRMIRNFVKDLGATPYFVDPVKHDLFVSMTSHLPAFIAGIISNMCKSVPAEFKGPGFRSITRIADTSPALLKTFLDSNRENILKSAKQFRRLLDDWMKVYR